MREWFRRKACIWFNLMPIERYVHETNEQAAILTALVDKTVDDTFSRIAERFEDMAFNVTLTGVTGSERAVFLAMKRIAASFRDPQYNRYEQTDKLLQLFENFTVADCETPPEEIAVRQQFKEKALREVARPCL